jgi:hypothetical protein
MLHFLENSGGDQNSAIDFPEQIRKSEADEVIERACIGNDDHLPV